MILRRGCNIDGGNVPETLMKKRDSPNLQTPCNRISKQSVEESGLHESVGRRVQQHHITSGDNKESNSIDIDEDELQQHRGVTNNFSSKTRCNSNTCPSQVLSSTFQPRPSNESMRNCTTLDRSLKDLIVNTVARKLLDLPLKSDKLASTSHTASEVDKWTPSSAACASKWRKGGKDCHVSEL